MGIIIGYKSGGNGALIGSSPGVVAAGLTEKHYHLITFNQFLKLGFPSMACTLGLEVYSTDNGYFAATIVTVIS